MTEKITWPGIIDTFRLSAREYLTRGFGLGLSKFKPKGFMEEIAMGQAQSRFTEWISSLTDGEAEKIRIEMIEALGGYTSRD